MSIENYAVKPEGIASTDPTGLPLFTTPPTTDSAPGSSRGRRRGGFTLDQGPGEQSSHPCARGASKPEPGRGDNVVPLQNRDAGRAGR